MEKRLLDAGFVLCGVCLLILALLMLLPVAVNLPDSWVGLVWIVLLVIAGSALVYRGKVWLRMR